ncbi:DUF115 domain-containing protein [Treponema pedis]|nr:DUF115 domain-containing protein [Treponema pedis]
MDSGMEKPELISTSSGFSVFYKNKYLYSRYAPKKAILSLIDGITIPPETLVLCVSPLLGYGLSELLKKLPSSSFAAAIEYDKALMDFSLKNIDPSIFKHENFFYARTESVHLFLKKIEKDTADKKLKKIIRLDFSAGAALYGDFYKTVEDFTSEYISRFWINKLTLIQFGRNYARNVFKNYIEILKNKDRIKKLKPNGIFKPILTVGAGPSLDGSIKFIEENKNNLFILAVDAAAARLLPKIKPDAIIVLESQYWIQKAFIGLANSKIPIIADLTSNPYAVQTLKGIFTFFFTEYTSSSFFDKLAEKKLLPPLIEPMGSVGLSALSIAKILASPGIPIFHTGLDFSWGTGFTHSKISYQVNETFSSCTRLKPLYSLSSITGEKIERVTGKNGKKVLTSPNLKNYSEIYKRVFSHTPNIFDIGKHGLLINSNMINENTAKEIIDKANKLNKNKGFHFYESLSQEYHVEIYNVIKTEKEKLLTLKNIFTHKVKASDTEIENLLNSVPYLYLHFADFSKRNLLTANFLNRIRIELEYFLKILYRIQS